MIIYCVPSNNTRLVIVSLSDCNQICKLLSGHNLLNSKFLIVLCCRCFFVKLFGTVVETSSGRQEQKKFRTTYTLVIARKSKIFVAIQKYMYSSGLLRHCVPRNDSNFLYTPVSVTLNLRILGRESV